MFSVREIEGATEVSCEFRTELTGIGFDGLHED